MCVLHSEVLKYFVLISNSNSKTIQNSSGSFKVNIQRRLCCIQIKENICSTHRVLDRSRYILSDDAEIFYSSILIF